jgi:hypothetical protein
VSVVEDVRCIGTLGIFSFSVLKVLTKTYLKLYAYLTCMKFILSHAFDIVDSTILMHLIIIWVLYNLNWYILLHLPLGSPLAYTAV